MPVFEYKCNACGAEFEELVRSADAEVNCPVCGSTDIEKLFSAFARRGGGCESGSCKPT